MSIKRKSISKRDKNLTFDRDGHTCLRCGSTKNLSIDHIIPICKGGMYRLDNYQTLCVECNGWKGDMIITYLPIDTVIQRVQRALKKHGECELEQFFRLFLHEEDSIVSYSKYSGMILEASVYNIEFDGASPPEELFGYVGKLCKKISARGKSRKFKSGNKVNTIKGIVPHEVLKDRWAFTFEEDESYVSCSRCMIIGV